MFEELIKVLMFLIVIVFFILMCYESINDVSSNYYYKYSKSIIELKSHEFNYEVTDGFKLIFGEGNFIVCKPVLIDNHPGRVCFAS